MIGLSKVLVFHLLSDVSFYSHSSAICPLFYDVEQFSVPAPVLYFFFPHFIVSPMYPFAIEIPNHYELVIFLTGFLYYSIHILQCVPQFPFVFFFPCLCEWCGIYCTD